MKSAISNSLKPTRLQDRIHVLDILRGISILFIFVANIFYFSAYYFLPLEEIQAHATYPFDNVLDFLVYALVDGKFYSIFSLLFGIGFVIQYRKLKDSPKKFPPFFAGRMTGLLLIGLCHIFIFHGDILTLYALVGFLLIPFREVSQGKLLLWASILILLPIVHLVLMRTTDTFYPYYFYGKFQALWEIQGYPVQQSDWGSWADFRYLFTTDNWMDFWQISLWAPLRRIGAILMEGRIFKVLALFLLGIWVGRKILDGQLLHNRSFLKKIATYGVVLGLPMNIFRTTIEFEYLQGEWTTMVETITYALGVIPLACAYSAVIALWCTDTIPKFLKWFAPVGRMALTNYVLQSIVATFLFFNIGLGLMGQFGVSGILLIAVMVFALQVILSRWWLQHFRYGPLEWIWRQMTYGRRIANKRVGTKEAKIQDVNLRQR